MRLTHYDDDALPRTFAGHPEGKRVFAETDIKVTPRGRLRMKLLIFRNSRDLCLFWKRALGEDIGSAQMQGYVTRGAVSARAYELLSFRDGKESALQLKADPRYFAVMGLLKTHLSMEIITHESVHAGIAYEKRHRKDFWVDVGNLDEENICYPAGRIAAAINRYLHDNNLYEG